MSEFPWDPVQDIKSNPKRTLAILACCALGIWLTGGAIGGRGPEAGLFFVVLCIVITKILQRM